MTCPLWKRFAGNVGLARPWREFGCEAELSADSVTRVGISSLPPAPPSSDAKTPMRGTGRCRHPIRDHEATVGSTVAFFALAAAMILVRRLAKPI